ncbi:MAG: hypothetical protein HRF50_01840 [Phycisphaerae bacterium]
MMRDAGEARQSTGLSTRKELALLFAFFHLLYAASSPGDLMTDSQTRWNVAVRLVDTGWVDVTPESAALYARGVDGRLYMPWSLGQSLLLVPFVAAGRMIAALPLPLPGDAQMYGQFLACMLLFPALGALSAALVYCIALDAGASRRAARWAAICLGLATMHWQHSVNSVDESQAAVCILLALWATQRAWSASDAAVPGPPPLRFRYSLIACVAAGAGLWFRLPSVLFIGVIVTLGALFELCALAGAGARLRAVLRWAIAGLIGFAPLVLAYGWFNSVRFGSPLETGYERVMHERLGVGLFDTPLWFGAAGMLVSPGKGLFVFDPVLLLAIPGIVALWRANRRLAGIVAAVFVASVLFHGRHTTWAGDLTWGTRYLVSQLGVWVLALLPRLERPRLGAAFKWLFSLSVAIQVSSVVYNYGLEFFQDRRHGLIPDGYIWRPAESQLACRVANIFRHLSGRPNYDSIPPAVVRPELHHLLTTQDEVRRLHAVHFFPFKALAATGNRKLFVALLVCWLALLAALLATGAYWRRRVVADARHRCEPSS